MSDRPHVGRGNDYSVIIEWDPEDQVFVATVPDLAGCATHGPTYEEAARQAQDAIDSWIDAAMADGTPVPKPRPFALQVQ